MFDTRFGHKSTKGIVSVCSEIVFGAILVYLLYFNAGICNTLVS